MAATVTPSIANAWQDPPWSDCGDPRGPDFGRVYVRPAANGALALTFDRAGRHHALTLFDPTQLGSDVVIYGRRFGVVTQMRG